MVSMRRWDSLSKRSDAISAVNGKSPQADLVSLDHDDRVYKLTAWKEFKRTDEAFEHHVLTILAPGVEAWVRARSLGKSKSTVMTT